MNMKRYVKSPLVLMSILIPLIGINLNISEAAYGVPDKALVYKSPDGASSPYKHVRATAAVKIDGVTYAAYNKISSPSSSANSGSYITSYPVNSVWGLKMSPRGFLYYTPNLASTRLTEGDSSNSSISVKTKGTKYSDYPGDVYWNYSDLISTRAVKGTSAEKIGSIDELKNFKPGTSETGMVWHWPIDSKYPSQLWPASGGTKKPGNSEGEGSGELYPSSIDNTSTSTAKYSGKIKYRNADVKAVASKDSVIKGEWRILGANASGAGIMNPYIPSDLSDRSKNPMVQNRSYFKKSFYVISSMFESNSYNSSNSTMYKKARESTYDRMSQRWEETGIGKAEMENHFYISAPASEHVTGSTTGWYTDSSQDLMHNVFPIPASYALDVEVRTFKIKDSLGNTVFEATQHTNALGIESSSQTKGNVKFQPGLDYTIEVTLRNRSNKNIYNPTINILGAKGSNATSGSYDLIDKGSNADGYWVYTGNVLQEKKEFDGTTKTGAGFFSVDGERLKTYTDDDGYKQKLVPKVDSNYTLTPSNISYNVMEEYSKETKNNLSGWTVKTIEIPFKIEAPTTYSELYAQYGESIAPANIRTKLAVALNPKHHMSDELFFQKNTFDSVRTTVDNLITQNDALAPSTAFYAQDLQVGPKSENIQITDSEGKTVASDELKAGNSYKVSVPVINRSTNFTTGRKAKVKISLKDKSTSSVIATSEATGTKNIGVKETDTATGTITIPKNASKDIVLELELDEVHRKNYEDWFEGNNKVSMALNLKPKPDIGIVGGLGDIIDPDPELPTPGSGGSASGSSGNKSTELEIFKDEVVNLDAEVRSTGDFPTKDVRISISHTKPDGTKVSPQPSDKIISSIDASNPQTVSYKFKSSETGVHKIVMTVNHDDLDNSNVANRQYTFKVTVLDDEEKYASTSHLDNAKEGGNNTISILDKFDSVTPAIILKRKDKENVYNESTGKYEEKWSDEYDYRLEIRDATFEMDATESVKITSVKFRSKYTKDMLANNQGKDLIDEQGYVDLVQSDSKKQTRAEKLAKVKAGYGFDIMVGTEHTSDLYTKYTNVLNELKDTGDLKIGNKKLSAYIDEKVAELNRKYPDSKFTKTSNIKLFPELGSITVNRYNKAIRIEMPDGEKATTVSKNKGIFELTKKGVSNNLHTVSTSVSFIGEFSEREDGLGGTKRTYYISNKVPNGKYPIKIGTSSIGFGGIVIGPKEYAKSGNKTMAYDYKTINIEITGSREEDLLDN